MDDYALVLNAGSSRLKFCVYQRHDDNDWEIAARAARLRGLEPHHGFARRMLRAQSL